MGFSLSQRGRSRRLVRVIGVGVIAALGLLLWARLKLVTDTPRMVYAEPKAGGAPQTPPAPSSPAR